MTILVEKLTSELFKPFGEVLEAPTSSGRAYFDGALANLRHNASPSMSLVAVAPAQGDQISVTKMERHQYSSQTFIPMDVDKWLVIVAPPEPSGAPNPKGARAFVASRKEGITYRAGVWHCPLTVLNRSAQFAIFMWLERSASDEEFIQLSVPFTVDRRPQ